MSAKTAIASKKSASFRLGDHVAFHFVNRTIHGVISEDMGAIGVKGRRLFHVIPDDPTEVREQFLVREEDLSATPDK